MAWTPPAAPKFTDLGEMPGIRRDVSDEERERMTNSDPNQDGYAAISRNLAARDDIIGEWLINKYGQTAMDIANFIDEWKEELYEESGDDINIFSDDFILILKDHIKETQSSFSPQDVYEIYMYRELSPTHFYYGVNIDSKTNKCYAIVTRGDLWDDSKILDEDNFSKYVAPDFLENPIDSRYDIVDDMTPSEVRRELRKLGFIEKLEVAGL